MKSYKKYLFVSLIIAVLIFSVACGNKTAASDSQNQGTTLSAVNQPEEEAISSSAVKNEPPTSGQAITKPSSSSKSTNKSSTSGSATKKPPASGPDANKPPVSGSAIAPGKGAPNGAKPPAPPASSSSSSIN